MRDWSSGDDDLDNEGDDFTPSRHQQAKRRKMAEYDEKPDLEAGSTFDFGDQTHANPTPSRRGRPPGRRNHQVDENAIELAPFMLAERRSTRAVVAAIQDALEPRHIAAARDCAMFNAKLMVERHRMGPVYMDKNTNALLAFHGHRAPYFPPETQGTPAGYEPFVPSNPRAKRQSAEQFYLASVADIHENRAYDGNPSAFAVRSPMLIWPRLAFGIFSRLTLILYLYCIRYDLDIQGEVFERLVGLGRCRRRVPSSR